MNYSYDVKVTRIGNEVTFDISDPSGTLSDEMRREIERDLVKAGEAMIGHFTNSPFDPKPKFDSLGNLSHTFK